MIIDDGGWIKKFYDKNEEYGFDSLIKDKKSSWSKGKLDEIESVFIFNKDSRIQYSLSVPNTEWHQFDRFCSILSGSGETLSYRLARVIQAKILPEHVSMNLKKHKVKTDNTIKYYFFLESLEPGLGGDNVLAQHSVGQWLSLILLPDNRCAVQLSKRGTVKWQAVHI